MGGGDESATTDDNNNKEERTSNAIEDVSKEKKAENKINQLIHLLHIYY